jgi:hypothetical protein
MSNGIVFISAATRLQISNADGTVLLSRGDIERLRTCSARDWPLFIQCLGLINR